MNSGISDTEIQEAIEDLGLKAARVTPEMINDFIERETYQRIEGTTVTVCVLLMRNKFTVIGHSACVSEENFNAELGRKIAKQKALDRCWELFGFQLASQIENVDLV